MVRSVITALMAGLFATSVQAQQPFYEGKTITVITSTGAGGGYDVTARLIARHMPKYIPGNPAMVVQNMPGGGNVLATNHMYTIAARDGTVIATLHNAIPLHQVLGGHGVRYDVSKFNWLGSTGSENEVVFTWHTTGVTNIEQAKQKEVIVGGTGAGSGIVIIPTAMNNLLGTKFKMVMGYKSSEDLNIALERGEVEARAFSMASVKGQKSHWVKEKKINIIAQAGAHRAHELPDVPLLTDLAKNAEERQVLALISSPPSLGRPFATPPEVPAERVAILRKAFAEALKDKALLEEAEKLKIEIDPISAEEVTKIVHGVVNASPAVVAKAQEIMGKKGK